jgi:small subunit ribosomal protein S14
MAKKSVIVREIKREKLYNKFLKKRNDLKQLIKASSSSEEKWKARLELQKLPKDSSPCRRVSRCFLTGRAHAVYSRFGISRIKLREYAMRGEVPGIIKSSW